MGEKAKILISKLFFYGRIGFVKTIGEGVINASGLKNAGYGEPVFFPLSGQRGIYGSILIDIMVYLKWIFLSISFFIACLWFDPVLTMLLNTNLYRFEEIPFMYSALEGICDRDGTLHCTGGKPGSSLLTRRAATSSFMSPFFLGWRYPPFHFGLMLGRGFACCAGPVSIAPVVLTPEEILYSRYSEIFPPNSIAQHNLTQLRSFSEHNVIDPKVLKSDIRKAIELLQEFILTGVVPKYWVLEYLLDSFANKTTVGASMFLKGKGITMGSLTETLHYFKNCRDDLIVIPFTSKEEARGAPDMASICRSEIANIKNEKLSEKSVTISSIEACYTKQSNEEKLYALATKTCFEYLKADNVANHCVKKGLNPLNQTLDVHILHPLPKNTTKVLHDLNKDLTTNSNMKLKVTNITKMGEIDGMVKNVMGVSSVEQSHPIEEVVVENFLGKVVGGKVFGSGFNTTGNSDFREAVRVLKEKGLDDYLEFTVDKSKELKEKI